MQLKVLSALPPGMEVRLPTEAQWEFACRAGTKAAYYSDDLDSVAWHKFNSGLESHIVGQKTPNAFGLYDMHGNVYQWCQDAYTKDYEKLLATDPCNIEESLNRVVRGGSHFFEPKYCRSAGRYYFARDERFSTVGFRVVVVSVKN